MRRAGQEEEMGGARGRVGAGVVRGRGRTCPWEVVGHRDLLQEALH